MGNYGAMELRYAEPFARGLVNNPDFRSWVILQSKFAAAASSAVLLHAEMAAQRSKASGTWWRSHWRSGCVCPGCAGGQETDLLAVFGEPGGSRFALHVEVKQPTDTFSSKRDQAANYRTRAECWVVNTPRSVLPHADADTMFLCSDNRLAAFAPHLAKFGSVVTFEQIADRFPAIYGDGLAVRCPVASIVPPGSAPAGGAPGSNNRPSPA